MLDTLFKLIPHAITLFFSFEEWTYSDCALTTFLLTLLGRVLSSNILCGSLICIFDGSSTLQLVIYNLFSFDKPAIQDVTFLNPGIYLFCYYLTLPIFTLNCLPGFVLRSYLTTTPPQFRSLIYDTTHYTVLL